ncbi:MAG TPA: VOC family protein [Candidatus Sulfotelmatobacter sp.]|jgi:predicted 3-demethylubiquinone-9 3-methyltransferase (glyoxalase superfamily)|nr:VOC family protein [Candidatus Sulfotelmatobacter sp.]
MPKITPFLWFDSQAEEAANFYCSIFPNSKIGKIARYGKAGPGPEGSVLTIVFYLDGQEFTGLNAGPIFKFNEAISFVVPCKTQEEIDNYWSKLTSGGGQESQCGWLKDKFGLSWQIVPTVLGELMSDPDPQKSNRVMQSLLQMKKLDIATLQKARDGK